jgi:CheY-like chemotaxis protein/HPt (histidine-containing phosphotransfer) domain-containing protein
MHHQFDNQVPDAGTDPHLTRLVRLSRRQVLLIGGLALLSIVVPVLWPAFWLLAVAGLLLICLLLWQHYRGLRQYLAGAATDRAELQRLQTAADEQYNRVSQDRNEQYCRLCEQYDCLVQHLPAGAVLLLDSALRCFYAEGALLSELVSTSTPLIGSHISAILSADTHEPYLADIQAALQGRACDRNSDCGAKQYILRIVPLQNPDASVYGVMLLACDQSALRLAHRETQGLRQQLADTQQAQAELQARLNYIVRTPLNTIDGLIELLLATNLDSQQRSYVEVIRQSSSSLINQINDLLPAYQPVAPASAGQPAAPDEAGDSLATAAETAAADNVTLRILLVEDHEVNRRVTSLLLEHLGYTVDVAEGGNQALEMLQARNYDIILMDIQMPDLDGIATTRCIRQLLPTARQPQIIALTANAMHGDREYYLQQGLDDYLAKPLGVDALEAALQRCLPMRQVRTQPAVPAAPAAVFDPERLEHLRSMAGDEGDSLVREVVRLFLDTAPEQFSEMNEQFQAGNLDSTARIAHRIKSSSAAIGVDTLAQLCSTIEQSIRQGNQQKTADLIVRSQWEYEQAERLLYETFLLDQES